MMQVIRFDYFNRSSSAMRYTFINMTEVIGTRPAGDLTVATTVFHLTRVTWPRWSATVGMLSAQTRKHHELE